MAFNPTETQKKAIKTRGNVLVSAAAGSGKTAVLVERVIKMLTDKTSPVSADRLLIVTFTNAAAAEMRNRIEKRLYEEIQNNPNDVTLQRQKYLLQSADIGTIDSFCINLVRENFEKCGIEPDFKISDGSQQGGTYARVMNDLIAEYIAEPSPEFMRLLELTSCEYDEKNLTELISRIYFYSQQLPFPQNYINGLLRPYEIKFGENNPWYKMAFDAAGDHIVAIKKCLQNMTDAAGFVNKNTDKHIAYADALTPKTEDLCEAFEKNDWNLLSKQLSNLSFDRAPASSSDDENGTAFKNNLAKLKLRIAKLCELFYDTLENVAADISQNLAAVKLLVEMITKYTDRMFEAFREENSFTFYNIEQLALNLLCEYKNGEIVVRDEAKQLCEYYDEVLVDEFQDVNDLQDTLFNILSNNEQRLFVVGDVKQSIYGFRGSNPDNFLNKKSRYTPIDTAGEADSKKIVLSDNFRSRPGVCEAVNFIFSQLLCGQCGSLIYNEDERLNAGGTFKDNGAAAAEILVIDKFDDQSNKSLLEIESEQIAEYIISVMNEGKVISEDKTLREAKYSDFAILLDVMKDKASVIAQALKNRGIPVSLGGDAFLESYEIATVMSLLQLIDNPKCDVELLTVMMSPLFGFTADEMAKIRANKRYGPLYVAVVEYSKLGDKKSADFIKTLTSLRQDAAVMSVDRLISKLIHSTDLLNIMSALSGGSVRRANLYALINLAKGFESRSDSGIYGFIRYIKSLPDGSFKGVSSGGENAVKIMSMHNSKGLQFPVCIVANLCAQINNADSINRVLFSEKGGISFKYYDEQLKGDTEMLGHAVMADLARVKTVEEKLRLLYVAATRAIDRLCFVCSAKNLNDKLLKLSAELEDELPHISREFLSKGRNMGDWILSCALLHPNGEILCRYADAKAPKVSDGSNIKISIANAKNTAATDTVAETNEEVAVDEAAVKQIRENADFVYPYEPLRYLQSKASVSRLVHSAEDDRFAFCERPEFMLGDKLTGAARGTAMHHVMQFISFDKTIDVNAEIERLIEWKFITEREAAAVDTSAIERFFKSALYSRIIASNSVHREMRFLSEVPAQQLDPTLNMGELDSSIIVQGAIDLCFVEDDGVVVLDFKTDRVDNMNQLVDTYAEQLNIYSKAAQKIFEKPIKEKIIYSFYLGQSISF